MRIARGLFCLFILIGLAACSSKPDPARMSGLPAASGNFKVGKPYQVDGVWYYPNIDPDYSETGLASWYGDGDGFHGKPTANGERYDMYALTAAHKTLPLPSIVKVTNLENGRTLNLRINDRGPFKPGRIIDVSKRGAELLGFKNGGTATVRVELLREESRMAAASAGALPEHLAVFDNGRGGGVGGVMVADNVQKPERVMARQLPAVTQANTVEVASAAPVAATAPAADPSFTTSSGIYVQAGAFSQPDNANRIVNALHGVTAAQVSPTTVNGQSLYRVRVPAQSMDEAGTLLSQVVAAGYPDAKIVVD